MLLERLLQWIPTPARDDLEGLFAVGGERPFLVKLALAATPLAKAEPTNPDLRHRQLPVLLHIRGQTCEVLLERLLQWIPTPARDGLESLFAVGRERPFLVGSALAVTPLVKAEPTNLDLVRRQDPMFIHIRGQTCEVLLERLLQ